MSLLILFQGGGAPPPSPRRRMLMGVGRGWLVPLIMLVDWLRR